MKIKTIKDTIHGYIQIEEPFWKILDTAEFQRLKWIEQTSYRVLYPSARHDRFIHSIGVFYLGKKAVEGFKKNCDQYIEEIETNKDSFLLACLLHDLGHAPFSHSCEDLYSYNRKVKSIDSPINQELLDALKKALIEEEYQSFCSDYKSILNSNPNSICKAPAPHEIMSAITVVLNFEKIKKNFESNISLDLIVRAILGCTFTVSPTDEDSLKIKRGIKNCFIRLLNSSIVDVDKLDYIARDTRMSGFDGIVIDSERLLESICVVEKKDGILLPAYKKSALSVIGNVVIAKNAHAKWIVQHPIVLYDAYLLRRAVGLSINALYEKYYKKESGSDGKVLPCTEAISEAEIQSFDSLLSYIFSSGMLSRTGKPINGNNIALLSDIEILSWMKQCLDNRFVSEYFSREERKHPIWKSHGEFLHYLKFNEQNDAKENAKIVADYIAPLCSYLSDIEALYETKVVNKDLIDKIKHEDLNGKEEVQKIIQTLLSYTDIKGKHDFEYCILEAKNTFVAALNSRFIYIQFGDEKQYSVYSDLVGERNESSKSEYLFFYIYSNARIDPEHFLKYLFEKASESKKIQV